MTFKEWFYQEVIENKGYSVTGFCCALEISREMLYQYFREEAQPSMETVLKMESLLCISYPFFSRERGMRGKNRIGRKIG